MKSAEGNGVVSSFFMYNLNTNCEWPSDINEIDIEMTGNTDDLYFTTHYNGPTSHGDVYNSMFNPHLDMHDYAIEWTPGVVRWFADGALVNVQDAPYVQGLIHPLNIMMNLWAAEAEGWVGPWDPSIMPLSSEYEYVRCYEYTPGEGNAGTGNNFSLLWEDDFDFLDEERWTVETFGGFNGNYCNFRASSVSFEDGKMILTMEEDLVSGFTVPVTFSVDASELPMNVGDVINLNGTFNAWCGDCAPMSENNGVWTLTVNLEEGPHEYLFVKNLWQETGGAPLGSDCDYLACDEYNNYGIYVSIAEGARVIDTHCWGTCENCNIISVAENSKLTNRTILKVVNSMGQEVDEFYNGLQFYLYSDGSAEKRLLLNPTMY